MALGFYSSPLEWFNSVDVEASKADVEQWKLSNLSLGTFDLPTDKNLEITTHALSMFEISGCESMSVIDRGFVANGSWPINKQMNFLRRGVLGALCEAGQYKRDGKYKSNISTYKAVAKYLLQEITSGINSSSLKVQLFILFFLIH